MIMTPEQLLIPRRKVSEEGYPDMIFTPGQMLTLSNKDERGQPYWRSPKGNYWYAPFFDRFPAIFKPLQWWEERKPEDMPEYLKVISTGDILMVSDLVSGVYKNHLINYLPATETDYNGHLKNK